MSWILKGFDIQVCVVGNFRGEGEDVCSFKKVGTKTKEEPVYEFVCPDNIKPEEWAPPQE